MEDYHLHHRSPRLTDNIFIKVPVAMPIVTSALDTRSGAAGCNVAVTWGLTCRGEWMRPSSEIQDLKQRVGRIVLPHSDRVTSDTADLNGGDHACLKECYPNPQASLIIMESRAWLSTSLRAD